jgi:pSer/pThr/pTyr-binding forkhead associated (FHA) protein
MSLKNWILHKMNGLGARADLPRSPMLRSGAIPSPAVIRRNASRGTMSTAPSAGAPTAPHLGPYAPLISAIREELEHFVVSYLRLHLAIAERDRYVLTSIDVRATGPDNAEELLRRFTREFKPEQIKHYLAKEIIGGLPNASAIDLSQFAGLNAGRDDANAEDDDRYSELLAELRSTKPAPGVRTYEVSLVGRWSEVGSAAGAFSRSDIPRTPRAGRSAEIAIEDAGGKRHFMLQSVMPGHRYAVGKGEGCDIVVNAAYASRRHCEIWLDHGAWWVTDAGSTNGVRVEHGTRVLGRSALRANAAGEAAVVEVTPGARIVLSAHAEGSAADYPRLMLDAGRDTPAFATPIAPAVAVPATPSTPIAAARSRESGLLITARMASGLRTVELRAAELPFSVGRSRSQALVVDWAHEGVSGHHIEIVEIDDAGVTVVVHGDNGVNMAGTSYPPGARLRWKAGESMALGRIIGDEPECQLTLSRPA